MSNYTFIYFRFMKLKSHIERVHTMKNVNKCKLCGKVSKKKEGQRKEHRREKRKIPYEKKNWKKSIRTPKEKRKKTDGNERKPGDNRKKADGK